MSGLVAALPIRAGILGFLLVMVPCPVARATTNGARVVLLDALVLTPALEKAGTRATIVRAVSETMRQRGWEPASISTDCHDLGCAGAVASAARAVYVIVLVGRYVPGETYVTDLGVSMWRDGAVIASRGETDEERDVVERGALLRCGPPGGACTATLLTSKMQQYTGKLVDDENAALKAREVAVSAPIAPSSTSVGQVGILPSSVPAQSQADSRGPRRIVGWTLVGGGGLLGAGAIALWTLNNSVIDCHGVPGDLDGCRKERRTTTAAILIGVGAVATAGAGIFFLLRNAGTSRLALSVHPSGFALGGNF